MNGWPISFHNFIISALTKDERDVGFFTTVLLETRRVAMLSRHHWLKEARKQIEVV